jgi:hypothetical protein
LDYNEIREEHSGESNESRTANTDAAQSTTNEDPGDKESESTKGATTSPLGDLPGAAISMADLKLKEVYGDYIHQNDGTHLDGGIADDSVWQARWAKLIVLPTQRYQAPGGPVGR